jgi:3-hydroxy-3-methylglutaryl CoA synthase
MKNIMLILILATIAAAAQTINCTTFGNYTKCQEGDGGVLGYLIGKALASPLVQDPNAPIAVGYDLPDFCRKNPGQLYRANKCPTQEEHAAALAKEWAYRHTKFRQNSKNAKLMVDYIEQHKLDPGYWESYDKAFKALKKAHQLELNK